MKKDWVWWIAHIFSGLVTLFWVAVTIAYAVLDAGIYGIESLIMMILVLLSFISVIVAWWRAGSGTVLLFTSAVLHGTFAAIASGHNHVFAVAITGGPYLVMGILFGIIWTRARQQENPESVL